MVALSSLGLYAGVVAIDSGDRDHAKRDCHTFQTDLLVRHLDKSEGSTGFALAPTTNAYFFRKKIFKKKRVG